MTVSAIAGLQSLLSYGLQTPFPLLSGGFYDAAVVSAYTTLPGAAGRIDLYPICFARSVQASQLQINVTAAAAGALARLLIYGTDASLMPSQRLFSGADLDCSTVGVKAHVESFTFLSETVYWMGIHHSANATLTAIAAGGLRPLGLINASATSAITGIRRTGVDYVGGAPATWGFSASEFVAGGAMPRIVVVR